MNTNEKWRVIEGFENYEVSNQGRVRNVKTSKVLNPSINTCGYLQVCLHANNKQYSKKVHRLVATAFISNPNNLPQVNHMDENKSNNIVENLEWCDRIYNCNYGTRNQRMSQANTNGKCSKVVLQYTLDGKFIKEWPSTAEIQRQLGYSSGNISMACNGKFKQMYGYIWRYK